jgi:hypothetical protein
MISRFASAVAMAATMSGCAAAGLARVDSAGAPVQSVSALGAVDLPHVLNPTGLPIQNQELSDCIKAKRASENCNNLIPPVQARLDLLRLLGLRVETARDREGAQAIALERLRLEAGFEAFYEPDGRRPGTPEDRRTRIQQRLITASNQNCGAFAQTLYGTQATVNAVFGSAATIFGGAGSIVTGVETARLLSGLSAITNGVRAEINEDYFRHQWVEALVKAIETDRSRLLDAMALRQTDSISKYPVEAAIADAIGYNNACSVVEGLKAVNQAVVIADDPAGLKAFRDTYGRAGFNAQFTITGSASPGAAASGRLSGSDAAITSTLAVAEAVSQAAEAETNALKQADKLNIPDDLAAAKQEIADAFAQIDIKDVKSPLYDYNTQLRAYETKHDQLVVQLAAATTAAGRQSLQDQLTANNAAADAIRQAALSLIQAATGRFAVTLAKYQRTA